MHDPISFSELVDSAASMDFQDYQKFLKTVNTRRVQNRPDVLPKAETDLLNKVYRVFPAEKKARMVDLNAKIWDSSLTEAEHQELLLLLNAHEKWAAKRVASLAELAVLRNTDYAALIKELGISLSHQND